MNERNEKWLDEQLKKTIDSGKVEFNAEQWKQKYSAEYQVLVSRTEKRPNVWRFLWRSRFARAAAVIAVAAFVIFFMPHRSDKHIEPGIASKTEQSPAMMMSRLSLMRAYNRGGMEAVDEQCEKAFKLLGPKTTKLSINDLLNEANGKERERKDL